MQLKVQACGTHDHQNTGEPAWRSVDNDLLKFNWNF